MILQLTALYRLLKDAESFTEKGVIVAKRLADYKTAQKYVKFGYQTFGLLDASQCVLLSRSCIVEDYDFKRVDICVDATKILDMSTKGLESNLTDWGGKC